MQSNIIELNATEIDAVTGGVIDIQVTDPSPPVTRVPSVPVITDAQNGMNAQKEQSRPPKLPKPSRH